LILVFTGNVAGSVSNGQSIQKLSRLRRRSTEGGNHLARPRLNRWCRGLVFDQSAKRFDCRSFVTGPDIRRIAA